MKRTSRKNAGALGQDQGQNRVEAGRATIQDLQDERDTAIQKRTDAVEELHSAEQRIQELEQENRELKKKIPRPPPKPKPRTAAKLRLQLEMSYDPPQQTWDQVTWRPGTAQANDFFVEQRGSVLTLTPSRGRHASAALVTTASLANVDACKKVTSYTKESIRLAVNATICLQVPGRSLSLLQVKDLSLQPPGAADRATTIDLLVTVRPLAG